MERRLEDLAAKQATREALEAQVINLPNMDAARHKAVAEWAASQVKPSPGHNSRLAAGHPNAQPLRNAYVEDDDLQEVCLAPLPDCQG